MTAYITNENTENAIAAVRAIFQTQGLEGYITGEQIKDKDYDRMHFQLWDYLDSLPLATVESSIIELEGALLGTYDSETKRIHTNLSQYLDARMETGEQEQ